MKTSELSKALARKEPMKTHDEIQRAHDILHSQVTGDTPFVFATDDPLARKAMHAALDALCWVLEHRHNQGFQSTLATIEAALAEQGYLLAKPVHDGISADWLAAIGFTRISAGDFELYIEPDSGKAHRITLKLWDGQDMRCEAGWLVTFIQFDPETQEADQVTLNSRWFRRRAELIALLDALGIFHGG